MQTPTLGPIAGLTWMDDSGGERYLSLVELDTDRVWLEIQDPETLVVAAMDDAAVHIEGRYYVPADWVKKLYPGDVEHVEAVEERSRDFAHHFGDDAAAEISANQTTHNDQQDDAPAFQA